MYATDFEYADKRLSDFGCITCYLDEKSGTSEVDIGCDITFNTIKNNHSSIQYKTSTSYENVYTTTFKIMKNPCRKSQDDLYMTYEEVRSLTRWLNRREYKKFKVLSEDMSEDIHYYGSFNIKELTISDRVVGLVLTFTGNAPYGFGELIKNEFEFSEDYFSSTQGKASFYIYGDSDEFGVVYPTITIIPKVDCIDSAYEIENLTTETKLVLRNIKKDEIITLDGEHKIIISSDAEHMKTLYNDFDYEWLDILIEDFCQDNEYTVNAPSYISIEYKPVRKVGVC